LDLGSRAALPKIIAIALISNSRRLAKCRDTIL